MSHDQRIAGYVSEQTKQDLEQRADHEDISVSALIRRYVQRGLRQDAEGDVAAEARAAEHLQQVLDDGLREFHTIARQIQDLNAKNGAYSAANFELIKQGVADAQRKKALQTGARRMQADDPIGDALDKDDTTEADTDDDTGFYDDLRQGRETDR